MSDIKEIFSSKRLTTLPKTNFSGINFNNIIDDITELVNENPSYNENWDDFLSSNAGRMMVELFAYIADQLATRIDWVVNENFIGTATQRKSIVRLLKLIGYNLSLPSAAVVPVEVVFDRPVGTYENFSSYDNTNGAGNISLYTLTAKGRDGFENKTFEAINYDKTTQKYLYRESIDIETGSASFPNLIHTIEFHEGRTYVDTITVDTNNNFTYVLPQSPVIENSVDVYILSGAAGEAEINLLKVESFLDPRAQKEQDIAGNDIPIPYVVNVLENDTVAIEFGPTSLLPSGTRRPQAGDDIRIFYRVGGGANGNITRRSINVNKKIKIGNVSTNVRFINNSAGTGGEESETLEYAANYGPLEIRTAQKAVTEEDYKILLTSDNTILKAQSFGNNNMPANLYNLYGLYIRPLEVWNCVLVNKPGWDTIAPSEYKNFEWISLRLENRFNQPLSFTEGSFNNNITSSALSQINESGSIEWKPGEFIEAFNYVIFNTNFVESLANLYTSSSFFKTRITSEQIDDNFFDLTTENNFFHPYYELYSEGTLRGPDNLLIKQDINAYHVSLYNYIKNDFAGRTIELDIDNRGPLTVTLPASGELDGDLTTTEFLTAFNTAFKESDLYNNDTSLSTPFTKGSQRLGLAFEDSSSRPKKNADATNVIDNLNSSYIILQNPTDTIYYYFWFNVDTAGTNPAVTISGETTQGVSIAIDTSVLTGINKTSFYKYVTEQLTTAIDTVDGFGATSTDTTITITNVDVGDVFVEAEGNSLFYNVSTQGNNFTEQVIILEVGETFLTGNTNYYFKINGIQYNFRTNTNVIGPSYSQLVDLIREATAINIKASFINQGTEVTITEGNEFIHFIKEGYEIKPVLSETNVLNTASVTYRITDVDWKEDKITIDNVAEGTISDYEIKIYPYDVEIITNPDFAGTSDISITNSCENPVGAMWLQEAQGVNDNVNLFQLINNEMQITPYDFDTYSTLAYGVPGNQDLGINGVIEATSGFHSFGTGNFSIGIDNYGFRIEIDDDGDVFDNGLPNRNFTIDATGLSDGDLSGLAARINTAFAGSENPVDSKVEARVINNQLRLTSLASGSTSGVIITPPTTDLNDLTAALGLETTTPGLDEPVAGLSNGSYSFILNNHTYTIDVTTTTTLKDIFGTLIPNEIDVHGYTMTINMQDTQGWDYEVNVLNRNNERVRFEDIDLFSSITINKLSNFVTSSEPWAGFSTPVGGGDYSSVAKTFQVITDTDVLDYFGVFSPSVSESSSITFHNSGAEDALSEFFGITLTSPNTATSYGYNKAFIIENVNDENHGKLIFELGSLNFRGKNTLPAYYHFVYNEKDKIVLGRYNTDNFAETDASYRPLARRIYNTTYDSFSGNPDINTSDFNLRFTKEETEEVSLYAIKNDWTLSESSAATIESSQFVFQEIEGQGDGILEDGYLNTDSYLITLNIDGRGDVEIDLTDNQGTSAYYFIDELVDNINTTIQGNLNYSDPTYRFFFYAKKNNAGDRIVITSPTNSNESSITIKEPINELVDVTGGIFDVDVSIPGYTYSFFAQGDYFIDLNTMELEGNFLAGNRIVTVTSGNSMLSDIANRIETEGVFKIIEVPDVITPTFVIKADPDTNTLTLGQPAAATAVNQSFEITDDLMAMYKIQKEEGSATFPDLTFYLHFIDDKRYTEGIYDGRVVETGEQGDSQLFTTNGYPLLSLDEDIYNQFLDDKKVVGVNHVFKPPKISTFDIVGTVYYKVNFSRIDVQTRVENSLEEVFSLANRDFGQVVARSDIMAIIHSNDGVDYVEISYLGENLANTNSNFENAIIPRFDEIYVLSEVRRIQGVQISGIKFDYKASGV